MLSMNDIAKKLNVGVKVVQNRFKKYGFTARSKKESGLICGKKITKRVNINMSILWKEILH